MTLICGHLTVSKQVVVNEDIHYSLMLVGKKKLQLDQDFKAL